MLPPCPGHGLAQPYTPQGNLEVSGAKRAARTAGLKHCGKHTNTVVLQKCCMRIQPHTKTRRCRIRYPIAMPCRGQRGEGVGTLVPRPAILSAMTSRTQRNALSLSPSLPLPPSLFLTRATLPLLSLTSSLHLERGVNQFPHRARNGAARCSLTTSSRVPLKERLHQPRAA